MQSTEERRIQNDRLTRTEMRRRERIRKKKLRRRITILIVLVIAIGGAIWARNVCCPEWRGEHSGCG